MVTWGRVAPTDPPTANLALGPSAEHNRLAEALGERYGWRDVEQGYVYDDFSVHYRHTYDDQSFYERDGASFYYVGETYRTGVLVR